MAAESFETRALDFGRALGHHQAGRLDQAAAIYRRILKFEPDQADALHYLGVIAYQTEKHQQAIELIQRAIESNPKRHAFYLHIGPAYRALRQYDQALAAYGKAIELAPSDPDAHNNLGNLYRQLGRFPEAIASFNMALSLKPDDAVVEYNLGGALCDQGKLEDAAIRYLKALQARPDYAEAHNDLGKVYRLQGQLKAAAVCHQAAVVMNPCHSLAYNNLAGILKVHGQSAQAVVHYRRALAINPDYADAYSNMLFALQYADLLTSSELFAEHLRYAERFETPLKSVWKPHLNLRDPGKKLNVAYVSADFNHHAVAYFIEPVLAHHDKSQINLYCYYNGTRRDAFTDRIKAVADHWIGCKSMSDEQLAERIRRDGIDILIDLGGHTAGNRLRVFARKPAPVQITWLGYFGTTGLEAMDYRFTDQYMDPPGYADTIHTEKLLRLPHFSPFQPAENSPPINTLPALRTGKITLASLNNLAKLNRRVVHLWARILKALPSATLLLCNIGDDETKRLLLEMFAQENIPPERMVLQPWLSIHDYLLLHHAIDLALDPFPYNGGTITNHSLWMGVPVVTLEGDRPVARIGASLMARAGLHQFIVRSEDEYLECVVNLLKNLPELNRIRLGLRASISANTSAGPVQLTIAVEQSYRSVWRKWCGVAPSDSLQTGLDEYKSGRLVQAEAIYREILEQQPDNPDALHLLGVLVHQQGHLDTAITLLMRAIMIAPSATRLCSLAAAQQTHGKLEAAVDNYRAALETKPENVDIHLNLADLLKRLGQFGEASVHARKALLLQPKAPEVHGCMGNVLKAQGDFDAAIARYDDALALRPDFVAAYLNRGNTRFAQGKFVAALDNYRKAVVLKPDYADAHNSAGAVFQALGDYGAAIGSFEKALASKQDFAEAHSNLANTLKEQGKLDRAIYHCGKALALRPNFAEAHLNLGDALQARGQLDTAAESYRQALILKPNFVEAYSNLGSAQQLQGKLAEALISYRIALAIDPQSARVHSNLLFALSFQSDCSPAQYLEEARIFDQMVAARAQAFINWPALEQTPEPLRVGLVSGDLKSHPVGFFLEGLLGHVDPSKVALYAYPSNAKEDDLTARIKAKFVAWQPLTGLADQEAATKIRADGIHILIDLAGHTAQNRLPLFAWKPAPVQLTWLGYWASTGMRSINYILADPVSVLPKHRENFSESVWYLPDTRLCFNPPAEAPELVVLPALVNGYVTFGCFQNLFKINDSVLALWARVMRAVPTAKLRLQNKQMNSPSERLALEQRLQDHGISLERVLINRPTGREAYLAAHAEVDIILDTFPYSGGTTTCEALWMGVPTLTLAGNTLVARQGMSLLRCAGLADWIADDGDAYVRLALAYASDLDQLAQLRSSMRARMLESPLVDGARFAQHLAAVLIGMWKDKLTLKADSIAHQHA